MSQHRYSTKSKDGKEVMVTLGYDRPLDYVFCTVTQEGAGTQPAGRRSSTPISVTMKRARTFRTWTSIGLF